MEKIFSFIAPFLSFIDSGKLFRKPFSWLYIALAALNVVLPFWILYKAIDSSIFDYGAKFVFAFLFIWIVTLAASWVGFQIWWNRRTKVLESSSEGSEFPATPVIAHFIQTIGEWLGSWVAIVGFGFSLFSWIFLGEEAAAALGSAMELPFSGGLVPMIVTPITGFMIIVLFRFFAEQCRALATIANNTKK
jgi:hypothetical protein